MTRCYCSAQPDAHEWDRDRADFCPPVPINTDSQIRIEKAIRSRVSSIVYAVKARKEHPSFGYSKAGILADFNALLGLVEAYALLLDPEGPSVSNLFVNLVPVAQDNLDVDLVALSALVKGA